MKILWLSGNPSLYNNRNNSHNGGGWIGALESILTKKNNIDLAICFFYAEDLPKQKINNTVYYPTNNSHSILKKAKWILYPERRDKIEVEKIVNVIDDFAPDIIHVWGTETNLGLITKYTNIPIIIHIQGIINPYKNAFLIPGCSKYKYVFTVSIKNRFKKILKNIKSLYEWEQNSKREREIFTNCKYFMGRTEWDKGITHLLAPNSSYFYCSELLRPPFLLANSWQPTSNKKLLLISVLSSPIYKGIDVALRCAYILKNYINIDFEWNIFGVEECYLAEKLTAIKSFDVNINLKGIENAENLIGKLQNSNVYIHTSYIENSPNSICEAQILGMPVIASNVGGVSSLIEHYKTGILVPANDPWLLAEKIIEVSNNLELSFLLGQNARKMALKRHNPTKVVDDLLSIYDAMINK